jgi:hypothetical protein
MFPYVQDLRTDSEMAICFSNAWEDHRGAAYLLPLRFEYPVGKGFLSPRKESRIRVKIAKVIGAAEPTYFDVHGKFIGRPVEANAREHEMHCIGPLTSTCSLCLARQ